MRLALLLTLSLLALLPATATAADPPPGSVHEEQYFETKDGVRLHADVLRPEGLGPDDKTPVILTVSPYTNHAAQVGIDYDPEAKGPSARFFDFLEDAKIFERELKYTYVMVDLRGFGGSAGCNDWGGPGEQEDVRAAVEWAASQSWSTGKVGMYGKSYDAWTGLMGIAQQPKGLAGVVSQEPVVDGYRYLYMNRVRFSNSVLTPTLFSAIDATPGAPQDTPQYIVNGTKPNAACYALNIGQQQQSDPTVPFWQVRNLLPATKGKTTPLFLTQGFLESNTKPDGVFELYNNLAGPKRAWFGQFDHVRGNDRDDEGFPLMGREGFIDETMRFFDHHVGGKPLSEAPTDRDPAIAVQDNTGRWRAEAAWPPVDSAARTSTLKTGTYEDDTNGNSGTGTGNSGNGVWSFSQPLEHRTHIAGSPVVTVKAATEVPDANLVANVYDVSKDNQATLLSRGAYLVPKDGEYTFELYGDDWVLEPGHRIGVLLSCCNDDWWVHTPTQSTVTVESASVSLPFLAGARTAAIQGSATPKLTEFLEEAPFPVEPDTIAAGETPFDLPPAQRTDGVDQGPGQPGAGGSGNGDGGNGNGNGNGGGGNGGGGSGGGNAGAQPGTGTPATQTAKPRLTLSLGVDRRRIGRTARTGFRVRARCSDVCDLSGRLTRGKSTVGRFERKSVSGRTVFTLKLTKAGARKLRKAKRATLSLRVVATHPDGRQTAATRALKLKR